MGLPKLFRFQREDLNHLGADFESALDNGKVLRALIKWVMGCGKTLLAFLMMDFMEQSDQKVFFFVAPTIKILTQTYETFEEYDSSPGEKPVFAKAFFASAGVAGAFKTTSKRIVDWRERKDAVIILTTYRSFPKLLELIKPDVVFLDEAHRMLDWHLIEKDVHYVGLSATPPAQCPLPIMCDRKLGWAIQEGILCDYEINVLLTVGVFPTKVIPWVFQKNLVSKLLVVTDRQYKAITIAEGLKYCGINAEYLIGSDDVATRTEVEEMMFEEEDAVFSTVNLYREGSNLTPLDGIYFDQRIKTPRTWFQTFGRCLRRHPGKSKSRIFIPVNVGEIDTIQDYLKKILGILKSEDDRTIPFRIRALEPEFKPQAKTLEQALAKYL